MLHCYQHPDRWTGVSCQRCDRPICPTCMRQASVGFQCPECVSQAAVSSPVISGRAALAGSKPVIASVLVALSVVAFLWGAVSDRAVSAVGLGSFSFFERWALYPPLVGVGEWWRTITGGFLHAGALHLGMNMLALWIVGRAMEPHIGPARFGAIYATSLIGGSLGVCLMFNSSQGATVGASGAVFGLFGALMVWQWSRGIGPMEGIGPIVLLNLVFTFAIPGISVGGHVGGLLTGLVCGAILFAGGARNRRPNTTEAAVRLAGVAVLGVVMFAATLAVANQTVFA